jgi:DNA-nicking Smr family endonuclease
MGRKKGRDQSGRRGLRRSIRYAAQEDPAADEPDAYKLGAPPSIMLRKLRLEEALERLAVQVAAHAHRGTGEVLVVHGRGAGSPGGVPIIGPAVRQWCDDHPGLVVGWREAPARWGGSGAMVLSLRPQQA